MEGGSGAGFGGNGTGEGGSVSLVELQRVNKIRRDFVANVSHELKTPATSLKLLAESLVDILDEDQDQARFFAEELRSETERLAKLITDLLDLTRLESAEGIQNPQTVGIRSVLMVVLARLRPAARHKNISLSWKRKQSKAALYDVRGDETQLTSLFANLVENAVKYTPRRARRGYGRVERERGHRPRLGHGDRHPREVPRAYLRAFLPGGQGPLQGDRRHRPGA